MRATIGSRRVICCDSFLLQLPTCARKATRFNYPPQSPQKFALSSLDAGWSSPYVPPDAIDVILPVVGSWWEDPRQLRKKRYHARWVIVTMINEDKP